MRTGRGTREAERRRTGSRKLFPKDGEMEEQKEEESDDNQEGRGRGKEVQR